MAFLPVAGHCLGEQGMPGPNETTGKPQQLALLLVMTPLTGHSAEQDVYSPSSAATHCLLSEKKTKRKKLAKL